MSLNFKTVTLSLLAMLLLNACSWFGDRKPEYLESREGGALQVPDDLDAPRPVAPVLIRIGEMPLPAGDQLDFQPPRVTVTAGGGDTNAYMAWSSSGAYMAVKDTPESVARRLRFAIQRSGMNLVERDDSGAHVFEYRHVRVPQEKSFFQKILFWRDDAGPDYSGSYRLRLEPDGSETRVYLDTAAGGAASTNAAEHVLGIFMERIG
ncbi:MAG: hypothetical protein HKN58_09810 [Xanthomonadales bacterium]|nr:hypothetical protein [Xanthomonadales bacterium]